MKIKILACAILFSITVANTQEINKIMDEIFKKELTETITITQVRNGYSWIKTILTNSSTGKTIELECLEYDIRKIEDKKKSGLLLRQDNDKIIDAYMINDDIIILHCIRAELLLDRIILTDNAELKRERYLLGKINFYVSGRKFSYQHQVHLVDNNLYLYVIGYGVGATEFIGVYNADEHTLTQYKFRYNSYSLIPKENKKKDPYRIFYRFDFYKEENKKLIDKYIYRALLPRLKESGESNICRLQNLVSFYLVSGIKGVMPRYNTSGITYFLYKEDPPQSEIKAIRYNHSESEWLFDDYEVVNIIPQESLICL